MKATGTLNTKIVIRKLQGSKAAFQFMLLAGFTPALSHTNCDYVESLSPNHMLLQGEIDAHITKFVKHSNAADSANITNDNVQKKLDKLFEGTVQYGEGLQTFAQLGIAQYL